MAANAGEKATVAATMDRLTAATIGATIAKAVVCILPIIPAVRVNLDGAAGQGEAWTIFAIGSVIAGAVFIELCLLWKAAALRGPHFSHCSPRLFRELERAECDRQHREP